MLLVPKVNIKQWFNLVYIVILFYALYCLYGGILAFDKPEYSRVYFLATKFVIYGCLPLGGIVLLQKRNISKKNLILLLLPLFYLLINIFYSYEGYTGNWLTAGIVIGCFLLFTDEVKYKIFKLAYTLFLVECIIALILWVGYLFHVPLGFSEVAYYGSNLTARYIKWGIFAIYSIRDSLRLCGIFNEPGGLGTLCALFFSATFTVSPKWQKLLLLATGFCTYSLAFYLLLFTFLALYMIRKNYKHIVWLLFVPILFMQIPNIDYGNEQMNRFAQRFAFSAETGVAGNNRSTDLYDYEFAQLMHSPRILIGQGIGYRLATTDLGGNSSSKRYVVEMGLIGFGIFLFLWFAIPLKYSRGNKDCLLFLLVFLLSAYQRPGALTAPYGYILIFGGFAYIQYYQTLRQDRTHA